MVKVSGPLSRPQDGPGRSLYQPHIILPHRPREKPKVGTDICIPYVYMRVRHDIFRMLGMGQHEYETLLVIQKVFTHTHTCAERERERKGNKGLEETNINAICVIREIS